MALTGAERQKKYWSSLKERAERADAARSEDTLVRAVVAKLLSWHSNERVESVVEKYWRDDPVLKTAVAPATIGTSGWASQLAQTAIADFVNNLSPASAGAQLLQRGTQLQFNNNASISVPSMTGASTGAAWVAEGTPEPIEQLVISSVTVSPRKLRAASAFTNEILRYSIPTIVEIVGAALRESMGVLLDATLLDSTAGDSARPAGLLNGISALGTASTTTPLGEAMLKDLAALIDAVSPVAGNNPIIIICAPPQASRIRMTNLVDPPFETLSTAGLADGTVLALASNALVSAVGPEPAIETTDQGVLHFEGTTPLAVAPSPSPVTAPLRSLWQTDCTAVRLQLEMGWALRAAGGIAFYSSVGW